MRSVVCGALGDPTLPIGRGVLSVEQRPAPEVGQGEVLIDVAAASINFPDALMVQGLYQVKPPLPFVPGSEVSGVVAATGPGVRRIKPGERVVAVTMGGAFSEKVSVPETAVFKLPEGIDLEAAAAVPVVYGTAHLALVERARLQEGQTLLVMGAAGGVGVAACQIGKMLGAKVVAVVRGAEKVAFMRSLGVDAVVDSAALGQQPLHKAIKAVAKKGANVVFDPVGGSQLAEAIKAAAPWGAQYLVIGFATGEIPKVPANLLLVKNMTMHGIFWGSYMQARPRVLLDGMAEVLARIADGSLVVHVSHKFPMERAPEAFEAILRRQVMGKALLLMAPVSRL